MPKAPKLEKIVTVECAGDGVQGDTVEIRGQLFGTMMVCDAQVFSDVESGPAQKALDDEYSQCLAW
jgi:hypothetical protein